MLLLRKSFNALLGAALLATSTALAQVDLGWQRVERYDLPPSIEVYESTLNYPSGALVYAVYALVDLDDPNLEWDVVNLGSAPNVAPDTLAEQSDEIMYVVTNGSFFDTTTGDSLTMLMDDSQVLSYGPYTYGSNYQTHGMVTRDLMGQLSILWGYPGASGSNEIMGFPQPSTDMSIQPTVELGENGEVVSTYPADGVVGTFTEVMAGRPVLVKNGAANPSENWPLESVAQTGSFADRNPRTAIGVTADNKMILMVIDGRQAEHSVGATLDETAQIMLGAGAVEAVNIDGGGSSGIAIDSVMANSPSDLEGARPVPNFMVIRRKAHINDTELTSYTEMGTFFESGNSGNYGESKTRLAATVSPESEPTAQGVYTLGEDIVPARYEITSQWAGSSNRSSATPFTIRRAGLADQVALVDQTVTNEQFNYVGTFDLAAGDQIIISNNASGDYIAVDAVRLRYVGESELSVSFPEGDRSDLVYTSTALIPVVMSSPNSAVGVSTLRVFRSVNGGAEEQVGSDIELNGAVSDQYTFSYASTEAIGSEVVLRFELEDTRGEIYSAEHTLSIKPFSIAFNPGALMGDHRSGGHIAFDVNIDTQSSDTLLKSINIYRSIDGGEFELIDTVTLTGAYESLLFNYLAKEAPGTTVEFRFDVETEDGNSSSATYSAQIIPADGDITIGFVSDMNGSYGDTNYDARVRNAFGYWVDLGVDAVISGGDMIGGGSSSLSVEQVTAMWTGFNGQLYSQLKNANIPFLFTMGNHDASVSVDRVSGEAFWNSPVNKPVLTYVDQSMYPYSWSAVMDFDGDGVNDLFFASIDSSDGAFTTSELEWLDNTLATEEAQNARIRMVGSHLSFYSVATERDDIGSLTRPREPMLDIINRRDVQFYFFGHSAAYFPGQRYGRQFLSLGEMGGGGKAYVGESQQAPSVISRADIFFDDEYYGENAVVVTTYDIFNDFKIVKNTEVPSALFGFDGEFIMRNDIALSDNGSTTFSPLNIVGETPVSSATGSATVSIQGDEVVINGTFSNLASPLLRDRMAISLYRGRNSQKGNLLRTLHIESEDGLSGTFQGRFPLSAEFRDGLAIGLYSIKLLTHAYPEGEVRGQLFNDAQPGAPKPVVIASQDATSTYGVRDVPALYDINWDKASDGKQGILTYTYQLATDENFQNLLIDEKTGIKTQFNDLTEAEWYAFLGDAEEGEAVTFYHRVLVSDGQNVVAAPAQELHLTKDNTPPDGAIEITAPGYTYQGVFAQTSPWHVYDIAIDEVNDRVWAVNYNGGINVYNADGTEYVPSLAVYESGYIKRAPFKGTLTRMGTMYGVEYDKRGFMIVSAGGDIFKLDVNTCEVLAYYDGSFGANAVVDDNGRVFCHGVFTSTDAYILEEDPADPSGYVVYSRVPVGYGPSVVRTTSYSPEGNAVYLPDATASRRVTRLTSSDGGLNWINAGDFEMNAPTGSNAIVAGSNNTVYIINNKSSLPPQLIFRDFDRNISWSQPLVDELASDIRAFTISEDRNTIYVGDVSGRIFKFTLEGGDGGPQTPVWMSLAQAAATNSDGESVQAGVYARVEGIVTTEDFADTGVADFFIQDGNAGVRVYEPQLAEGISYSPRRGDRIAVQGTLSQVAGQVRISADAISLVAENQPLPASLRAQSLADELESRLVTLHGLSLVDTEEWTNSGYVGFTVEVSDGSETYEVFIHHNSPLFGQAAPVLGFNLTGVVTQSDESSPYTEGLSIMPRNAADFTELMAGYDDWSAAALAEVSEEYRAAEADPDGDGISNLMEWIWGLSPTTADGSQFEYMQVSQSVDSDEFGNERYVTLTFYRPSYEEASVDFGYKVQGSSQLGENADWQTLSPDAYTLIETAFEELVEVKVTLNTPVSGLAEKSYLRVLWEAGNNAS